MIKFDIADTIISPVYPSKRNDYEESVRLSEAIVSLPFTKCQVEQLKTMWKESCIVNLSQQTPYLKGYSFLHRANMTELNMLISMRPVYIGYNCIHYDFHDDFIKGVLFTKILRRNYNILQNVSSDNVRALFIHAELLRIIHFSTCNVSDRLNISSKIMESMHYDFDEDASPANIVSLCVLEGYIKKYEFKEGEEAVLEFYEPIDYNLDELDIFSF
ncbi:hypothetical protein [Proteiniclasticum ruminis]|uniref:Uncharacterized protein n=1 Tax=Proteiniclasticum ruminis TaxID=398199 RepID=A0A1G8I5U9_9CLOT|nr:hypothetical protein [Proteiniclasticum ruminis]SDI14214.1 hypothetical protein SAMN05421804_101778 [Proteiniclasticum ruminis]